MICIVLVEELCVEYCPTRLRNNGSCAIKRIWGETSHGHADYSPHIRVYLAKRVAIYCCNISIDLALAILPSGDTGVGGIGRSRSRSYDVPDADEPR